MAESLGIIAPQALPASPDPPAAMVIPRPALQPVLTPTGSMHAVDIASFVADKKPKTDIQFVTVVAYYHRFVAAEATRLKTITVEVARDATRLADWDRLKDAGSTLNNAKRQGYLDSAGPGKFSINTVGENLVARTLPGTGESASRGRTKNAGKKKGVAKRKPGKPVGSSRR